MAAKDTAIDYELTIVFPNIMIMIKLFFLRLTFSEKRVLPSLVLAGLTVYFATAAIFYFDF